MERVVKMDMSDEMREALTQLRKCMGSLWFGKTVKAMKRYHEYDHIFQHFTKCFDEILHSDWS